MIICLKDTGNMLSVVFFLNVFVVTDDVVVLIVVVDVIVEPLFF